MRPFRDRRASREQLRERVRDAALEAAHSAPARARELGDVAYEAAREAAQNAPERVRELRKAAAQLDLPWARSAPARLIRENFVRVVINRILDYYSSRRSDGYEQIAMLDQPVILVANHSSHMDTPVILSALPRRLREHTAVAAAADYFYRNKLVAAIVSLCFNTVPLDRKGGSGVAKGSGHLDKLLNDGWNLLLYP
ncbi:MAG: 1-acyl-sn-glycerol-3-phosphate acyltransferase, partial [Solirubrobacteraceae bacterium]